MHAARARFFAAVIAGLAMSALAPAAPQTLFNGHDLQGWGYYTKEPGSPLAATWSVRDGIIACMGTPVGYLRTEGRYANYRLTVEWRWVGPAPEPGAGQPKIRNSGVLVHMQGEDAIWPKSLEAQLMMDNAGDIYVIGGVRASEWEAATAAAVAAAGDNAKAADRARNNRRMPKQEPSSERPLGEWNTYDIVCRDDTVTLTVNGVLQNRATGVSVREGHICLQSEGAPIEFRQVTLTPLE